VVFYLVVVIIVWGVSAVVASFVAPEGRATEFGLLTLLFLDPLGVGFAAVAGEGFTQIEATDRAAIATMPIISGSLRICASV
jgi:hypothetical protein